MLKRLQPFTRSFYTQEERLEFYASIADIEKADPRLYRCHRSFVVNPQNITKIDKEAKKVFWKWGQLLDLTDQVQRLTGSFEK